MLRRPVVYLDSSDYSRLSNEKQLTPALRSVRERLTDFAATRTAIFVFSSAIISEMAPIDAAYSSSATARASLLTALCGRFSLVSLDKVVRKEINQLANRSFSDEQILSDNATWFPDISDIVSPLHWADISKALEEELKPYPRKIRRAARAEAMKRNTLRASMREWLGTAVDEFDLSSILRLYPMRPQDAKVLARYSVGKATREEAEDAFLESLRDPSWMMRWFEHHDKKLSPIKDWVRKPSQVLMESMQAFVDLAERKRRLELSHGLRLNVPALTKAGWEEMRQQFLVGVVSKYQSRRSAGISAEFGFRDVERFCPGIHASLSGIHSSLWTSLHAHPRPLAGSDFVDCIHAMYSPYVTHFRADGYMAPHIRRFVSAATSVVARLEDLPDEIERWSIK